MTMMTGAGMTGAGVAHAAESSGNVTVAEVLGCERQTEFAPTIADQVLGGGLTIAPWKAVGLTGNIDWSLNPFRHPTWETKFRSLRWVDTLVDKAVDPSVDPISRLAFKNRAQQILQDWIRSTTRTRCPSPGSVRARSRSVRRVCSATVARSATPTGSTTPCSTTAASWRRTGTASGTTGRWKRSPSTASGASRETAPTAPWAASG